MMKLYHGPSQESTALLAHAPVYGAFQPCFHLSVPYTVEGVRQFLDQVKPFVKTCELDSGIAARVALEELVYEIR